MINMDIKNVQVDNQPIKQYDLCIDISDGDIFVAREELTNHWQDGIFQYQKSRSRKLSSVNFPIDAKFVRIPDFPADYMSEQYMMDTPKGKIIIGKHKMIFGDNIRAGYADNNRQFTPNLMDLACGDIKVNHDYMLHQIMTIMLSNPPEDRFMNIPGHSLIKPCINDGVYCSRILTLYKTARIN